MKVKNANDAFQVYKSGDKMIKKLYYDIVKFLVPLYDPKTALNSGEKAKMKLDQFEVDYSAICGVLIEVKLSEYNMKQSGSKDFAQLDSHLEQFHKLLHLDSDSKRKENCNALLEPTLPIGNDNTGVYDGKALEM